MKEKETAIDVVTNDEALETNIIFSKPYIFEGKEYTYLDLAGLNDLKASDMIEGQKYLGQSGEFTATPELSMSYICFIASRVTGKPIEFFYNLPAREALKLKNRVTGFFYGKD